MRVIRFMARRISMPTSAQGRLRRLLADWLHEAQFRSLVSGYQPAHPKHGGGGAFYVRLRRIRSAQ